MEATLVQRLPKYSLRLVWETSSKYVEVTVLLKQKALQCSNQRYTDCELHFRCEIRSELHIWLKGTMKLVPNISVVMQDFHPVFCFLLLLLGRIQAEHGLFNDGSGLGFPGPLRPEWSPAARHTNFPLPNLHTPRLTDNLGRVMPETFCCCVGACRISFN